MILAGFWNKLLNLRKKRKIVWGMAIDMDKCSGCMACVQACRSENNISYAGADEMNLGRGIFWLEMIPETEGETDYKTFNIEPTPCYQCDNTPCIKYCPTHATETNIEGVTGQVYDRCIGCRYCTVSCPYTRRYFNWYKPNVPDEMRELLNPDVTLRYKGIVEKCNFCYHKIRTAKWNAKIENRELKDGEVVPACQQTCPSNAIEFGNLQDRYSKVYKMAHLKRAEAKMAELGTEPKVFYLKRRDVNVD